MKSNMETTPPTTSRLIRLVGIALLAGYVITCVHHIDEGLGFVFGFIEPGSLLAPLTFGIILLLTLGLLYLYQQTRNRLVLVAFSITTILWGAGIGLFDGFYNHTLSILLALAHVPPQSMRMIYPTYRLPTNTGIMTFPCDGTPFRFCALTAATVLYEGTGILQLVATCVLALAVYRMIRWHTQPMPGELLPRAVVGAVILGLVATLVSVPLLGSLMSTGQLSFLISTLSVMGVSVLAVGVAIVWLRKERPHQPQAHSASTRENGGG